MARRMPNAYPPSHTKAVVYTYYPRKEKSDSEDVTHRRLLLLSRRLPYKVHIPTWLNFSECTILKTIWDFNMLNTILPFPCNILRLRYITSCLDYSNITYTTPYQYNLISSSLHHIILMTMHLINSHYNSYLPYKLPLTSSLLNLIITIQYKVNYILT